jgi:hypothetical protein
VIEEETGAPLDIQVTGATGLALAMADGASNGDRSFQAKLVARDDKKNPLISTFAWTDDAAQRILRVPAGFMRNKTQERIEELARERAAAAIDLALVEDGIEIGKKMMAEMIAAYPASSSTGASPAVAVTTREAAPPLPAAGGGYLNEVRRTE